MPPDDRDEEISLLDLALVPAEQPRFQRESVAPGPADAPRTGAARRLSTGHTSRQRPRSGLMTAKARLEFTSGKCAAFYPGGNP